MVLLVTMLLAVGASPAAAATKPYTLNISPSSAPAGARVSFTATFANPADAQQQLGSANLTAPSGFRLVSASVPGPATATVSGGAVQLRGAALQPGSSLAVTVVADVPCSAGTGQWTVLAKQANDFKGPPGNDLTLDASGSSLTTAVTGACALRFVTQPANARVSQTITGTAYTPSGPPVSVEVIDGSGTRITSSTAPITLALGTIAGSGSLGGTTTVSASSGLASFGTLAIDAPGIYRLAASSPGLTSATSLAFRIDTVAVACAEDATCTGSIATSTSRLSVTAFPDALNPDAAFLTLSLRAGLTIDCGGYQEFTPDTALMDVTAADRTKTATLVIDKRQMNLTPNNGAAALEMCFGSPQPFVTNSGAMATVQSAYDWNGDGTLDPVYVGLLPDCGAPPCVSARNKTGSGDGVIEARLPAGLADPAMRG
jgi:hypothetical protein